MRLDIYLVDHLYVKSRSQATDLIKRGLILVDDKIVTKPGYTVESPMIKIIEKVQFVGRAGEKLKHALFDFNMDLRDKVIIDIGSSTGGFTDCALQHGAKEVFAYDVGSNQMDETLKKDARIHLHEGTNILDVDLPFSDVILIDVSFTSIKPIFKHIVGFQGEIIALIKPQFEAGHIKIKQGVLKDLKKHKAILIDVLTDARLLGFHLAGLKKSNLKGKAGNQEYVLYIKPDATFVDIQNMVGEVLC